MAQYGTLNNGLSKVAQAMTSGAATREAGRQAGLERMASTDNAISNVFLNQAKARQINDRLDNRAQAIDQFVMSHAGITAPQLEQFREFQRTGKMGNVQFDPETVQRINNGLRAMAANQAATGDTNASQLMQGMRSGQDMAVVDKALGGDANALALSKASPKFEQNSNGVVLDRYGGGQNYDKNLISQVFKAKSQGENAGGGKLPSADIQLINRLTLPTQQGGVGMDEQQAFAWLNEYKNDPRNAVMRGASEMVANNWMRPADQQLDMQQAMQLMVQALQEYQGGMPRPNAPTQPTAAPPSANYVWTPNGMQAQ